MKTRNLLPVLASAVIASGCIVDNRASVTVQALCYPTEDCVFSATCDLLMLGTPRVDTSSTTGALRQWIQVANQLPNNADDSAARTNTNDAHIDEVLIEYDGAALPVIAAGTNQWVPAAGTRVIGVDVLPAGVAAALPAAGGEIVAHMRLRGYYDNGGRFETGDFPITVGVCDGCAPVCALGMACGYAGQSPATCVQDTAPAP